MFRSGFPISTEWMQQTECIMVGVSVIMGVSMVVGDEGICQCIMVGVCDYGEKLGSLVGGGGGGGGRRGG